MPGDDLRQAVDPEGDPVIELEAGIATQVLDGAGEFARIALGAQVRV